MTNVTSNTLKTLRVVTFHRQRVSKIDRFEALTGLAH